MDAVGSSVPASPCSSYQPSPHMSYNPSPSSSSFPSPAHYMATSNGTADVNSLIPWLKNLSSNSSSTSANLPYLYLPGGSISAPVTPPMSSPTCSTPRMRNNIDWDDTINPGPPWSNNQNYSLPSSTPPSPGRQVLPEPAWLANFHVPQSGPNSPTFSLVSPNPFGFRDEPMTGGSSRMWTPGQSGTCSPAVAAGSDHTADVPISDGIAAEFAFGSCSTMGVVNAWEGERIHDECVPDDLELKL